MPVPARSLVRSSGPRLPHVWPLLSGHCSTGAVQRRTTAQRATGAAGLCRLLSHSPAAEPSSEGPLTGRERLSALPWHTELGKDAN